MIRLQDDPDYDQRAFEELLEIKGDSDHSKLIAMLEAVNDNSIPISTVLDRYFDPGESDLLDGVSDPDGKCGYAEPEYVRSYSPLNSDCMGTSWTGTTMEALCGRNMP